MENLTTLRDHSPRDIGPRVTKALEILAKTISTYEKALAALADSPESLMVYSRSSRPDSQQRSPRQLFPRLYGRSHKY